jgi:hypothetical protein
MTAEPSFLKIRYFFSKWWDIRTHRHMDRTVAMAYIFLQRIKLGNVLKCEHAAFFRSSEQFQLMHFLFTYINCSYFNEKAEIY